MSIDEYKAFYYEVLKLADDTDSMGLFENISEEDIIKAKWIACIMDCLNDVPVTRMEHIFEQKKISFDLDKFYNELGL